MKKEKSRTRGSNKFRLFILVNVMILLFLVIGFGREYVSNIQIEREIALLDQEKERLENEKLDTLNLIEELSSEYYLEKEGRVKHGLGKEGETLIVIQDSDLAEGSGYEVEVEGFEKIKNPERWFFYFFDKESFDQLKTL